MTAFSISQNVEPIPVRSLFGMTDPSWQGSCERGHLVSTGVLVKVVEWVEHCGGGCAAGEPHDVEHSHLACPVCGIEVRPRVVYETTLAGPVSYRMDDVVFSDGRNTIAYDGRAITGPEAAFWLAMWRWGYLR